MNTTIDINILPKHAQNELRDFYEFLVKKYVTKSVKLIDENQKDNLILELLENPLKVGNFKPFSRNDIYEGR